jgi:hypothetical protein
MMQDVSPRQTRSQSALKHRELDHTIFNLATRESGASDTLERVPMFVEIAEGLILCSKRRLETAHLSNRADRQNESDSLSLASLGLGHDPDILGHRCAFSQISFQAATFANGFRAVVCLNLKASFLRFFFAGSKIQVPNQTHTMRSATSGSGKKQRLAQSAVRRMMVHHASATMMTEPQLEVSAELRELAETTIDQAERAFGLFFDAARRSTSTAPTPVQELSKMVLAFLEESLKTSFEYARKLALTNSLQEAANVQAELVKRQIACAQQYIRELARMTGATNET